VGLGPCVPGVAAVAAVPEVAIILGVCFRVRRFSAIESGEKIEGGSRWRQQEEQGHRPLWHLL
jgi:hypothetical protein